IKLNIPVFTFYTANPLVIFFKLWAVFNFIKMAKPDTIAGWMGHGNLAATVVKLLAFSKAKLIWHVRMTLYDLQSESFWQRIALWGCRILSGLPARILYNSATGQQQHEAYGFNNSRGALVDNGFDIDKIYPDSALREQTRNELGILPEHEAIGLIARYHPMKNHRLFIQAAAQIAQNFPNTKFILAGKGCDLKNSEIMTQLEGAGLTPHFILLGRRDDICAINNALDIAVSTSSWGEGFSNTLAEAMACSTPCVATDIGGARHVIGETGMVVSPNNLDAFVAAIEAILQKSASAREEMRRAARQRIVDHFDIRHIARQYLRYYTHG
ncbi:MAG TPA: glycosyltransferase, partial [Alphaproteobacteria bacterium]|nr:glycosyltransferase [Alphaproteobacteria bacterium]